MSHEIINITIVKKGTYTYKYIYYCCFYKCILYLLCTYKAYNNATIILSLNVCQEKGKKLFIL